MMKELNWSLLKAIYQSGMKRGNDEATAYDHGTTASGKQYDEMVEALYDYLNEGIQWHDDRHQSWDVIKAWIATQC